MPVADQLSQLANIGNQALKYLQQGNAPADWKRTSLDTITTAKKPWRSGTLPLFLSRSLRW